MPSQQENTPTKRWIRTLRPILALLLRTVALASAALGLNRSASHPIRLAADARGIACSMSITSHSEQSWLSKSRCHRLSKECLPAPAVRRRRVVKGTPANKTARLEEKLDGLVSLLQSTSKAIPIGSGNDAAATVSPQPLQSPRSDVPSRGVSYRGNDLGLHLPEPLIGLSNAASRSTIHNSLTAYVPRGFEPLATEGEANLETFKHFKLKYFPFIALTRSLTAQELRKERPFLWFCIMAVCSKSSVQQIALGNEIRTIIGRQLLLEGERSLDLLLGLLIYISW